MTGKLYIFWITIGITAVAALFAGWVALENPISVDQPNAGQRTNPYMDTCVITTTHPDPVLQFVKVEHNCDECRYWFCIIDKNSPLGTHAVDAVLRINSDHGPVNPDGQKIPGRRLDGYVYQPIQSIPFKEIRFGEEFYIQGSCPDCLWNDERFVTFNLTYWDCGGSKGFELYFDLEMQREVQYIPQVPPTVIDCRPGDPCERQPKPEPCGC